MGCTLTPKGEGQTQQVFLKRIPSAHSPKPMLKKWVETEFGV